MNTIRLNAFCNSMTTDGNNGTRICRHADRQLYARFGWNKAYTGRPKWRCYADLLETNTTAACVDNEGNPTSHRCKDPDYNANTYCSKGMTGELRKLIVDGCPYDSEAAMPVATTVATTTRQTTTRKSRKPTDETSSKRPTGLKPRDPLNKLAALERKLIDQVFAAHFDIDSEWGKRTVGRIMELLNNMRAIYAELNPTCGYFVKEEDAEQAVRFDETDPCRAFDQLTRNIAKWSETYNAPCDGTATSDYVQNFKQRWARIADYLKRKMPNQLCASDPLPTIPYAG